MPKALQIAIRTLLYILRVALWAGLAVGLIILAFDFAKDMSNIYIIATDGMQKRATFVLQQTGETELTDFFTQAFIDKDALMSDSEYDDYYIRDFDYKISVEWMWTLPWNDTAKVRAREQMPTIDGEMLQEKMPQGAKEKIPPPPWKGAVYEISMERAGEGKWLISGIETLELLPEPTPLPLLTLPPGVQFPTPKPTVTPSPTPRPSVTPSPSPTASGVVVVE